MSLPIYTFGVGPTGGDTTGGLPETLEIELTDNNPDLGLELTDNGETLEVVINCNEA